MWSHFLLSLSDLLLIQQLLKNRNWLFNFHDGSISMSDKHGSMSVTSADERKARKCYLLMAGSEVLNLFRNRIIMCSLSWIRFQPSFSRHYEMMDLWWRILWYGHQNSEWEHLEHLPCFWKWLCSCNDMYHSLSRALGSDWHYKTWCRLCLLPSWN